MGSFVLKCQIPMPKLGRQRVRPGRLGSGHVKAAKDRQGRSPGPALTEGLPVGVPRS